MRRVMPMYQIAASEASSGLMLGGMRLCCGQPVEVLLPSGRGGRWQQATLEYGAAGWYLTGLPGVQPVGLWAREVSY